MGRPTFRNLTQAEHWIKDKVINSDKGYYGFHTDANEIILIPSKSTRPVVYGYVKNVSEKEARNFFKETNIILYPCQEYDWSAERSTSKSDSNY